MTQPCRPAALPASSWRSGGLWGGRTTLEPTPTALRIFCLSDFSPSRSLSLLTFCRRQRGKYDRSSLHGGCHVFSVAKYFAHLLFFGVGGDFSSTEQKRKEEGKKRPRKTRLKKQHSVLSFFPLQQLCLHSERGRKNNLWKGTVVFFFCSHEVSESN